MDTAKVAHPSANMDTINNIANAATKAIWGENTSKAADDTKKTPPPPPPNEEPISGVQGETSKGEPFDAGNAPENSVVVADDKDKDVDKDAPAPNRETPSPTAAQASSKTPGDSTQDQVDTRTPENKQTTQSVAADKNDVDTVAPMEPDSVKGPGPKPLDQVAKEHGGDAGNVTHDGGSSPAAGSEPQPPPKEGDEGVKKAESHGGGEKVVKSSGLVADGGDFDAANPGAGREADRLLEQKGIHRETTPPANKVDSAAGSKPASPTSQPSSPERKGVRGLGHKIKAKLRRGSNNS